MKNVIIIALFISFMVNLCFLQAEMTRHDQTKEELPTKYISVTRYFFINAKLSDGRELSFSCERETFPSLKEIEKSVCKKAMVKKEQVLITGIYEFKNSEDYKNFNK